MLIKSGPYANVATNGRPSSPEADPRLWTFFGSDNKMKKDLEDLPTPPWVYRALCETQLGGAANLMKYNCLEPCCNRMYGSDALHEYFNSVESSDVEFYGYGNQVDFLSGYYRDKNIDWIITNPPFSKYLEFCEEALAVAVRGVAMLAPSKYLCGVERFEKLYGKYGLTKVVGLSERPGFYTSIPTTAANVQQMDFSWFIWDKSGDPNLTLSFHIEPGSRKKFSRLEDEILRQ